MANDEPSLTNDVICRYFKHGACMNGDDCKYKHSFSAPDYMVCRFYLQGHCSYGDKCRYDHVKPNQQSSKPAKNNNSVKKEHNKDNNVQKSSSTSKISSLQNMVVLGKDPPDSTDSKSLLDPAAAEFVPGLWWNAAPSSYVDAAKCGTVVEPGELENTPKDLSSELCPYAIQSFTCPYGDDCDYVHGDLCDFCGRPTLHPTCQQQRSRHRKECIKEHEEAMEESFAIQSSKDRMCGVCMEVVWEKNVPSERRFGVLSNCNHCFCLSCIRKWRTAKNFDSETIRSCPECRVQSDFVTPSKFWVEGKEAKEALIVGYKANLRQKPCKYFDEGRGECPFNENCFYAHKYSDGRAASPKPRRRRRKRQNALEQLAIVEEILLSDFLEARQADDLAGAVGGAFYADLFQDFVQRLLQGDVDSEDISD